MRQPQCNATTPSVMSPGDVGEAGVVAAQAPVDAGNTLAPWRPAKAPVLDAFDLLTGQRRTLADFAGHPLLVNFLLVLNDHDRLTILPAILFSTLQLRDQRAGRIPVVIHTAVQPTEEQVTRIRETVRTGLNLDAIVETRVEPELLGGVLLRIGDWVFDGSIRTRLEQIRNQILSRGANEIQSGRDRFSTPD